MHKYHFNIAINKKLQNAGTKANVDCKTIMHTTGYTDIEISFVKSIWLLPFNLIRLFYKLSNILFRIPAGSLIVTQYPLLGINRYFKHYAAILRKKSCTVACIIHDLDSLRGYYGVTLDQEIEALNAYDVVITHNPKMTAWLHHHGYQGRAVEIGLFDYLTDFIPAQNINQPAPMVIAFAGNLAKCGFLKDICKIKDLKLNLYGPGFNQDWLTNPDLNIRWLGSFPIDDIIYKINGDYGLIWDGDSINEVAGTIGNYLRYNAPHKLSLYLATGIPVIIPENAALANFVKEKNIGITINSLTELPKAIAIIEPETYEIMRKNAVKIGEELRKGKSFAKALNHLEQIWQTK